MTWPFGASGQERRHPIASSDGKGWYDPANRAFGGRTGGEHPLA